MALLVALVTPARAQTGQVTVEQLLDFEYLIDNKNNREDDDDFGFVFSQTNLRGSAGNVDTQVRVDGFYAYDAPTSNQQDFMRLERMRVAYRLDGWTVIAGDDHIQLGRGFALSLKPIPAAGVDVALRGGSVGYRGRVHEAQVFGGQTNTINLDPVSRRFVRDQLDLMVGGRYAVTPAGWPTLSVHAVHVRPEEQLLSNVSQDDHASTVGGTLEFPALTDWASVYGEYDFQRRIQAGSPQDGKAGYLQLDLSLGETLVLIEGLYLDAFELRGSDNTALKQRFMYNRPPTLERFDQEILNFRDVAGGRVRVERSLFSEDLTFHVNGMAKVENFRADGDQKVDVFHVFAGVEADLDATVALSGGYRHEANATRVNKTILHTEGNYVQPLAGPYSLISELWLQYREIFDPIQDVFQPTTRGSLFIGLDREGTGSLTVELGYDDQNSGDGIRTAFVAGIIAARLADWCDLRVVGGTQRGGIKCVGGICREYPAFAGGRTEWVLRF